MILQRGKPAAVGRRYLSRREAKRAFIDNPWDLFLLVRLGGRSGNAADLIGIELEDEVLVVGAEFDRLVSIDKFEVSKRKPLAAWLAA
ncbi:MAG: hypothetical protein ACYS6K_19920 [Planctomycetota bacterium]